MISCRSKDSDNLIASVNEKVLLRSQLLTSIPSQLKDSTYFVEKFINDWIRRQLLLSHAEINLNVDLANYEKQVEDYRASLLIFAYQQELINRRELLLELCPSKYFHLRQKKILFPHLFLILNFYE